MNEKRKQKILPSWTSDLFLYLSGFLMILGVILATVEIPIRITNDSTAAEQTTLIKGFFPFSIGLWILGFVLFGYSLFLWSRKSSDSTLLQKKS